MNDITLGAAATWVGFPIDDAKLSLAGSWSTFDGRKVRFSQTIRDHRPVGFRLGADYDYKPNRRYYGIGNNTPETNLSYFLLSTTNAEAAVLFGASPRRQVRLVGGYSSMSPGSGYHGSPLLQNVFPLSSVPYATQATQVLWYSLHFGLLHAGQRPRTHARPGRTARSAARGWGCAPATPTTISGGPSFGLTFRIREAPGHRPAEHLQRSPTRRRHVHHHASTACRRAAGSRTSLATPRNGTAISSSCSLASSTAGPSSTQ